MRVAVLSPHRDDAAFSCGITMYALLQAGASFTVVNVFTRSDYAVDLCTVDPVLPLIDGVSRTRRREDESFASDLATSAGREPGSVQLHDLDQLDAPLRLAIQTEQVLASPLSSAAVQEAAKELASELTVLQVFDLVFAPLALGDHVDHRIVREAARLAVGADHICFYEDLPYAARLTSVQRKEQAFRAIASNSDPVFVQHALHFPYAPHLKQRFAMHYPSQIAPEVAEEMAAYTAQWDRSGAGAERWWAVADTGSKVKALLRDLPARCNLVEE